MLGKRSKALQSICRYLREQTNAEMRIRTEVFHGISVTVSGEKKEGFHVLLLNGKGDKMYLGQTLEDAEESIPWMLKRWQQYTLEGAQ